MYPMFDCMKQSRRNLMEMIEKMKRWIYIGFPLFYLIDLFQTNEEIYR